MAREIRGVESTSHAGIAIRIVFGIPSRLFRFVTFLLVFGFSRITAMFLRWRCRRQGSVDGCKMRVIDKIATGSLWYGPGTPFTNLDDLHHAELAAQVATLKIWTLLDEN
jgi:hypothetical protein